MLKELDRNTIHIILSKSQVSLDMLFWSAFLLLFMVLVELIIVAGNAPWPVMLMPLPCLPFALFFFNQWHKWFSFGQLVKFNNGNMIIVEKFLNIIPRKRRFSLKMIRGFSVVPFVVYRRQTTPAISSATTKGFCVKVLFHTEKLFWFVEKNTPYVTIGGYLKREEAKRLHSWLNAHLADRTIS